MWRDELDHLRGWRVRLGLALALVFVACGDDDSSMDASTPDVSFDAAIVCDEPATTCPEDQPIEGAPCVAPLECMYVAPRGFDPWIYTCDAGAWVTETPCAVGGCAPPPLAELCRDPFSGMLGASVSVGPATSDAFRPFAEGEEVRAVVGGQGAAMLEMALSIDDADALTCIQADVTLSSGDVSFSATSIVRVDCGRTRRIFVILQFPELECDPALHDVTIDVDVAGVGSTSVTVQLEGGYLCFG